MSPLLSMIWLSPRAAYQELLWDDARLVDVRPAIRRATYGEVHPALRPEPVGTDRLDERLDPTGRERLPWATYDARVLVLGHEGDDAAPVADALRRLGLRRAAYVRGGFTAWVADGMPVARPCGPVVVPIEVASFHAGDVASALDPALDPTLEAAG